MNQLAAFKDTVALAESLGMEEEHGSSVGLEHLREMLEIVENSEFSESKLGRWLGWAQCALVSTGLAGLEDMKLINMRHADG